MADFRGAADRGRVLHTAASRSLSWDANGNAATAKLAIAVFDKSVTLSFSDFPVN